MGHLKAKRYFFVYHQTFPFCVYVNEMLFPLLSRMLTCIIIETCLKPLKLITQFKVALNFWNIQWYKASSYFTVHESARAESGSYVKTVGSFFIFIPINNEQVLSPLLVTLLSRNWTVSLYINYSLYMHQVLKWLQFSYCTEIRTFKGEIKSCLEMQGYCHVSLKKHVSFHCLSFEFIHMG